MIIQSIKAQSPGATGERGTGNGDLDNFSIHTSPPLVNKIEPLLRASEVARYLAVSRTEAYRLMQSDIPTVHFGKQTVRVRLSDLQDFIQSRTVQHG